MLGWDCRVPERGGEGGGTTCLQPRDFAAGVLLERLSDVHHAAGLDEGCRGGANPFKNDTTNGSIVSITLIYPTSIKTIFGNDAIRSD